MQHSSTMPQGPILMTRPVKPKPKNQFGGTAWGPWAQAPPNCFLGFGLTGLVIRMGPWGIMQECYMIHLESCRCCMIYTHHAGHPTA